MDYVLGACLTRIGLQHWDEIIKRCSGREKWPWWCWGSRTLARALVFCCAKYSITTQEEGDREKSDDK
jgi:hypothetical protein